MKHSVAVITISDKCYVGERVDTSGPAICSVMEDAGFDVIYKSIVPDETELIKAELIKCADEIGTSLILTTGGTGFSQRDITPEATLAVIDRETSGIAEAMRAESLKITPRACLSRAVSGIRGSTLIVNLPGSEKAARENLSSVLGALDHGLEMLSSKGSANCAAPVNKSEKKPRPSADAWLKEAKADAGAYNVGMYLLHNGVVRETAKARVRSGDLSTKPVVALEFSYDSDKLTKAVAEAYLLPGVYYIKVWLNEGILSVGDDIMLVLIGADTRPNAVFALEHLVGEIKTNCVSEKEIF
ncbi:MAG: hypothetical protein GX684_01960 [Ruminococcaceae bacterium]|nr:hypothetical protein [Oscillospiraceae bacterium]